MPEWPNGTEGRLFYKVINGFNATCLDHPRNMDRFKRDEEFYEPATSIRAGDGVQAFPTERIYRGQEVVLFTQDGRNFFVDRTLFLESAKPSN